MGRLQSVWWPGRSCALSFAKKNQINVLGKSKLKVLSDASTGVFDKDNPHMILKVSPGTTFLGLLAARRTARAEAGDDKEQIAKVEGAFRSFVDKSEAKFKEEVEQDPTDPVAVYNYANFLQTIEDYDRAEEMYREAIALDPDNVDVINNLALLLHEQRQDFEGADKFYAQAVEVDPENVDVLFNWALLKKDALQDLEAGCKLVDKVLELRPTLAEHPLIEEFQKARAS